MLDGFPHVFCPFRISYPMDELFGQFT